MKINGFDFDLEKAARDVALAYAKESLNPDFTPSENDVDSMLEVYINAYIHVASKSPEWIESLLRWSNPSV